jgi:cytidyltransferase-like protein
MKDDLLLEGAVAGHMNHIYDNGEMTFGELKQLLQAAVDGKLRGTEKTDGQNLSISFNARRGRAIAARNKGQLKSGGLDPEELDSFFSEHPSQTLRYSFVEALLAFENAVKDLDKDTLVDIFGLNNQVYYNVEVMNPGNPDAEEGDPRREGTTNVIPYDKKTLLIHEVGHFYFDPKLTDDENAEVNVSENYNNLERVLRGEATDDPTVFSVETHPQRKLAPAGIESMNKILQPTIDAVDNLMQDIQVNDSDTINHYVAEQVGPEIEQFGLTEDINRMILRRVMKIGDYQGVPQITKGMPVEVKQEVSQFIKNFNYASYTLDLQRILHGFSSAALEGFESAFIGDNQKQINLLQDKIKTEIDIIAGSSNERARAELEKQMVKLKSAKGINTPSEGFVFDWNGTTYKFTGNFAPANQILGMRPFNRFGPIEPTGAEERPLKGESEPLVIGIVPGAFKPPHKGHLSMVEALAENADKVIVMISKPLKSGRTLPMSKKSIDSNHAEQIWKAYLDKSPAGRKTVVMQSPSASPVGVTYDFVMQEPDVTNQLIAPRNATILLGCGDKEDDSSRYETITKKAREDLKIEIQVCDLVAKHTGEYLQFLQENPEISEGMPSNGKSTVDVADLHASDMRYVIDVAAENPAGLILLEDFVPNPEDALAVMGILGINPAGPAQDEDVLAVRPEEDQVEEPEIDQLEEIINQEAEIFFEGFRAQKSPKGKKDSGKFQTSMRKRLSKAQATYLDTGRKDLTKYGGGFHLDRPKHASNAFLAEEELDEMSAMASGAVAGFSGPIGKHKRDDEMTKEEKKLRRKIRIGLKEFFSKKTNDDEALVAKVLEEHSLRMHLRDIIFETSLNEAEDPSTDLHDNTGMNTLKELIANSNILSMLRVPYMSLQTDPDQRKSFRAHIIQWVQDTLAPVKANDEASAENLQEELGIDIEGVDASNFIDADDGSEEEVPEDDGTSSMKPIEGQDGTGRNSASVVYPKIEKSIITYYAILDNPKDQELFHDYLIANLKMYFDKWENMLSDEVKEPSNAAYDQATAQAPEMAGADPFAQAAE